MSWPRTPNPLASLSCLVVSPRARTFQRRETAVDAAAYAAQIAAQLGANVIKVKLPSAKVELADAQKAYQKYQIPIATLAARVRHVVQSSFNGQRIVIFSAARP